MATGFSITGSTELHQERRPAASPWLAGVRRSAGAPVRLFCFPYSGAGANLYYSWSDVLMGVAEVCPVELPGHGTRLSEAPFTRLTTLIPIMARALRPFFDRPFAFFGHSMGALLGFELARYVRRYYGLVPQHLFVSGHNAPQGVRTERPIHGLPEDEFAEEIRRMNGTPEQVLQNAELRALILPILRADFAVCETYRYLPDEPLACPISALGGVEDEYVDHAGLAGWNDQTSVAFSKHMFRGDHFFLISDRARLLRLIAQQLSAPAAVAHPDLPA